MEPWMREEQLKRLAKWGNGETAPPSFIEFEFTNYCQFRCPFCIAQENLERIRVKGYQELSREQLGNLVREAASMGVMWWSILGGEPSFELDRFMQFAETIKQFGMYGQFVSNGWGWTEESLDRLAAIEWDLLNLSLYSHDPAVHDAMVGRKGALDKARWVLDRLQSRKAALKHEKPILSVNSIINRNNYLSLDRIVADAAERGVRLVCFLDMEGGAPEAQKLRLDASCREQFQAVIERIDALSKTYGISTNIDAYRDTRLLENPGKVAYGESAIASSDHGFASVFCFDPWRMMKIDAIGLIGACRAKAYPDATYVHEGDLAAAWYDGPFQRLRAELLSGRVMELCNHCCAPVYVENRRLRDELRAMLTEPLTTGDLLAAMAPQPGGSTNSPPDRTAPAQGTRPLLARVRGWLSRLW